MGQKELKKRKIQEEKQAFGTYAGDLGTTLTYRVKKPGAYGGYKIVTEVCAVTIEIFPSAAVAVGVVVVALAMSISVDDR